MRTLTLPSGRTATINEASFAEAMQLKNAVYSVVAGKIDLHAQSLFHTLMLIDSDEHVQDALFVCMSRCMIGKEKVTRESFEGHFADYTAMVQAILEADLLPFLESLLSLPTASADATEGSRAGK